MRYMLDTNILIYRIKNKPPSVATRINALDPGDELCVSFFTYAELLKGAQRSTRKADVLKGLADLTRSVPVRYGASATMCEHYAVQFNRLRAAGTPVGANDLWIGCHALADDCTLVTHNIGKLERVQGLKLDKWAA